MTQKPTKIIPELAIGKLTHSYESTYTEKDSILYSLGIGFSQDPLKREDYKYTNQFDDNFCTFPTYLSVLSFGHLLTMMNDSPGFPHFSPFMLLHAEQRIELLEPLKFNGKYQHKTQLIEVADKGKIALAIFRTETKLDGKLIGINQSSTAIKGLGGFGYKGNGKSQKIPDKPSRKCDLVIEEKSFPGQAFLYQLNGDSNPLHLSPEVAALQNFPRPIIHGLASYGIVARGIVQQVLNHDSSRVRVYHTRFLGHLFPGESYRIEIWKQNGYIWFQANVVERNTVCLIGYLTLRQNAKL